MPEAFEIVVPASEVGLGTERTGAVTADVTSRLNRNTTASVQVLAGDGADAAWFGEPEPSTYASQVGQTQKVRIPITVPTDASAGKMTFRVRAYAEDRPSEDYTESAPVQVGIPEPPNGDGVPTWLIALVGAIVLAVLGVGAYLWLADGEDRVDVPTLVGATEADARTAAGDIAVEFLSGSDQPVEVDRCVLFQFPPSGSEDEPTRMAADSGIVTITVPCPATRALTPETVEISTGITLDGADAAYDNLCDVGEAQAFCDAIEGAVDAEDEAGTGAELLESEAFDEVLREQERLFRTVHSDRVVPDLTGLREGAAKAQLDLLALELEITEVLAPVSTTPPTLSPGDFFELRPCDHVLSQDPGAGTAPEDIEDGKVRVSMRQAFCPDIRDQLVTELDLELFEFEGS